MTDYVAIASEYRAEVLTDKKGKIFGKYERLACKRSLDDEKRAAKNKNSLIYFDDWWANDVCDFIEKLPHVEGQWDNPNLVLEPWQIFLLTEMFGWRRIAGGKANPESDPRRFDTAYIEVARKNGKSALSSGIALYCLLCENEPGPQVKTAATTGDQARIVFDVAKKMVEKTPDLQQEFTVQALANAIACWGNGGSIKPINAKASTQDGLNPHLTIIDELHAHKDRALFDVLKSARGARKNPLSWYITTAGYNTIGVCMEQRTFLSKVLEGVIDADHYFGVIYTIDEKDDPFSPKVWRKANPNLGVSVQVKDLENYAKEAQESPESEGEFKTKRLNVWLNAANAWLNMAQWAKCKNTDLRIEDFKGCEAWVGSDLSDKNDCTSSVVLFKQDDLYIAFPRFYLPRDLVHGIAHKRPEYKVWAEQGFFTLTDGDYIDYNLIERDLNEWGDMFTVKKFGFDQYGSAQISTNLINAGRDVLIVNKSAANCSDPAKILENKVKTSKFQHPGNPVLTWMASNVVVTRKTDGSILPKKETPHSENKIDGIDAVVMAIKLAEMEQLPPPMIDAW